MYDGPEALKARVTAGVTLGPVSRVRFQAASPVLIMTLGLQGLLGSLINMFTLQTLDSLDRFAPCQ